ncbi:MAG: hypothetical protein OEV94_02750 [Deltaproteobacteria bacterium]|nr:hypothetical protein [Deltaproteobacteria bacterium]
MTTPEHSTEMTAQDPWDHIFTRANVVPAAIQGIVTYAFTLAAWVQAVLHHSTIGAVGFFAAGVIIVFFLYTRTQNDQDPPAKTLSISAVHLGFMLAKFSGFYLYLTTLDIPWF